MRRKVEILKYSSNRSSTQTNNLTKNQQFSMLARGSYVQPPQSALLSNNAVCQPLPTPTTACDVPGPVTYLYEEPDVPLYNLTGFNVRSYPDYVPENKENWQFISPLDVSLNPAAAAITNYLVIYQSIDKPSYTYTLSTPITIFLSGTSINTGPTRFTLQISSATLSVYYNQTEYKTYTSPTFDTSMSVVFDVSNSTTGPFSAKQFVGNMSFFGIQLYTSPTFVYSFSTKINMTLSLNTNVYSSDFYFGTGGLKYGAIANSSTTSTTTTGPIHILSSSDKPNLGAFITGV